MAKLQKGRENQTVFKHRICPRIHDKIEKLRSEARRHGKGIYAGEGNYEVTVSGTTCRVNIATKECDCRLWQLTGIPCIHGCVALNTKGVQCYDDYVDPLYHTTSYFRSYSGSLTPIPDSSQWPKQDNVVDIEPPKWRQGAGRPKRARRKDSEERAQQAERLRLKGKLTRVGEKQVCRNCQQGGHNKRSCKNATVVRQRGTGKVGRPPLGGRGRGRGRGESETTSHTGSREHSGGRGRRQGRGARG